MMNLQEYIASTDENLFWRLGSGEHQNLLDEALERIKQLQEVIKWQRDKYPAQLSIIPGYHSMSEYDRLLATKMKGGA